MFVVLYLADGISLRTSSALAGTLAGILITARDRDPRRQTDAPQRRG